MAAPTPPLEQAPADALVSFLTTQDPKSAYRLGALAAGLLLPFLNALCVKYLGHGISESNLNAAEGIVGVYLAQSVLNAMHARSTARKTLPPGAVLPSPSVPPSNVGVKTLGLTLLLLGSSALFLPSCATTGPLQVTGEALDATEQTFIIAARGMEAADRSGQLTAIQVERWNDFKHRFTASYHLTSGLWRAAKSHSDSSKQAQLAAVLEQLGKELDGYVTLLLNRQLPDGGAP